MTIADAPLFLTQGAEPLVMLTLSNDEQLYHKAYTDFDDVDGDRLIDTTYKDTFNYTGYFDPKKCYSYSGAIATASSTRPQSPPARTVTIATASAAAGAGAAIS